MGMGDSAAERQSLEHLALADIKGNLDFELGPVSRRLKAITTKKDDLMRLREVYKQLSEAFPSDTTVTSVLAWLNGKLAPPTHESGTPHE